MAAIELGELPGPAALDAHPRSASPASSASSAYGRWPRLVAVLALLLATMGAGRPWPRPLPQAVVPARLGATIFTAGDRLFVADPVVYAAAYTPYLAAFRLPDAEPLWRVPLPLPGPVARSAVLGETLVLASDQGSVATPETVTGSPHTGWTSWTAGGRPGGTSAGSSGRWPARTTSASSALRAGCGCWTR